MTRMDDWTTDVEIQWCPGCPNFGILQAFKMAMVELGKQTHELCLVSGIGQAAKLPHYVKANFFNGLHGRALPAALAIHAANPELTTIVTTGEGDCYGEGGNHFIHTIRRNPNMTLVVHNNGHYALTKGQASPTTAIGQTRAIHLRGVESAPLQTLAIAIAQDCSFVARGFAGDIEHLKSLLVAGIRHEGFSYIDVIQPCITWGKRPLSWYRETGMTALMRRTRGVGRICLDFFDVLTKKSAGSGGVGSVNTLYNRWPHSSCAQREPSLKCMLRPAPDGPATTLRYEALCEGIQYAEALVAVSEAIDLKADALGAAKVEACRRLLTEMWNREVRAGAGGGGSPLRPNHGGWQEQIKALFDAAGECARAGAGTGK